MVALYIRGTTLSDSKVRAILRDAIDVIARCCGNIEVSIPTKGLKINRETEWSYPYMHILIHDDNTYQWCESDYSSLDPNESCPFCDE